MAADDKMSTDFTGESATGQSKSSKRLKTIGGIIFVVGILLSIAVNSIDLRPNFEERRAAEAAEAAEAEEAAARRTEQIALARAVVNEELLRFDRGVWLLQDHTQNTEREVFMDSFSVDSEGKVKEFVFKYSFTGNGNAYANTWSCEASQMERYDCTVRQQYDGGSWRNEGDLVREDDASFNGRYLYERQWYNVSLVRKEE